MAETNSSDDESDISVAKNGTHVFINGNDSNSDVSQRDDIYEIDRNGRCGSFASYGSENEVNGINNNGDYDASYQRRKRDFAKKPKDRAQSWYLPSFDLPGDRTQERRNQFLRGSDPRIATCRGKLQSKRSKLNQEINKELRLRAGAENLYKATSNRKLRETVALELSFVNSNLQLLKEQLAELNSSVEVYQNERKDAVIPMIPLGLKETKEIDFTDSFKDFILEHYSEDAALYENAIADLMDMRQAMRTPLRDSTGISLLFRYYNQLYFIERRFFPPDRSLGIYFEWYDSLTGVPSCQRTVAFEKACVLFNIAALYTQMGAKQDRLLAKGLDSAVDSFLRAAGTFRYIHENFTNAPSMDLNPNMLEMLVQLILTQARECLYEKLELQSRENRNIDIWLDLAQESAQLSEVYANVHSLITFDSIKDYVPYSWIALVDVKREHYKALSHYNCAMGVLSEDIMKMSAATKEILQFLHLDSGSKTQIDIKVPKDDSERKLLGKAHLREALLLHEESQRLQRMCRELKTKEALADVLLKAYSSAMKAYSEADEEDDFREILDPPRVQASTKFQLSLTCPDFGQHRVEDLFKGLGPVAIFSAKHHWTAPRVVRLSKASASNVSSHKSSKHLKASKNSQKSQLQNSGYLKAMNGSNGNLSRRESRGCDGKFTVVMTSSKSCEVLSYGDEGTFGKGNMDLLDEQGFGFSVRGDAPVIIASVDYDSLASQAGVKEGDFIVAIGHLDVKWATHNDVVNLIKSAGDTLVLKLVTPMDRNYLKPKSTSTPSKAKGSISTNYSGVSSYSNCSSSGISSGTDKSGHSPLGSLSRDPISRSHAFGLNGSSGSHGMHGLHGSSNGKRLAVWNPFKRHSILSKSSINKNDNVILR